MIMEIFFGTRVMSQMSFYVLYMTGFLGMRFDNIVLTFSYQIYVYLQQLPKSSQFRLINELVNQIQCIDCLFHLNHAFPIIVD